jgi:hypothetical protein
MRFSSYFFFGYRHSNVARGVMNVDDDPAMMPIKD